MQVIESKWELKVSSQQVVSVGKVEGIFAHVIDRAAFIDRAEFGVWGTRRTRILPDVAAGPSRAIGGEGRLYARSIHGVCTSTGNTFELRYGRMRPWRAVPPFRLVLIAQQLPLTGAQLDLVTGSLLRRGYRFRASRLELTFDVSDFAVSYFRQRVFTSARRITELRDDSERETFYVGGPRSPWQLCVYQKDDSMVRLEFRFRRGFLRAEGIEEPNTVLHLRQMDLWKLARFRDFREMEMRSAVEAAPENCYKGLLLARPHRWPLQTLALFLRGQLALDPNAFLKRSHGERRLRHMQRNLIW